MVSRQAARAARLHSDQSGITNERVRCTRPRVENSSFVNAIGATMSKAEADRLSKNPNVLAVVPDSVVKGAPIATPVAAPASGAAPPVTGTPAGVCPSNPSQPLLEPEALQLMKVDFGPGSNKPAAPTT